MALLGALALGAAVTLGGGVAGLRVQHDGSRLAGHMDPGGAPGGAQGIEQAGNSSGEGKYAVPLIARQTSYKPLEPDSWETENANAFLKQNKAFRYTMLTDVADNTTLNSSAYLQEHFDSRTVNAFRQLALGAAKADFIRYCVLYQEGGVYFDLDTKVDHDMIRDGLIQPQDTAILLYDWSGNARTDFLAFAPKHAFLKKVIDEMVSRVEKREPNVWLATGPHMFTDVFLSEVSGGHVYRSKFTTPSHWRLDMWREHGAALGGRALDEKKHRVTVMLDKNPCEGPRHYRITDGPTPDMYPKAPRYVAEADAEANCKGMYVDGV